LLALVAVDQLIREEKKELAKKYLLWSLYIVGGILLIFILFSGSLFSFSSPKDAMQGLPDWLIASIQSDRQILFRNDAIRSFAFIILTFGALWFYLKGKLKLNYLLLIIPLLVIADLWPVSKRYLNNDDFIKKGKVDNPYQATTADLDILKDQDLSYRVYNMNEAFDASARTSYFHKNIGGYHGAKMRRYQEIIDHCLVDERLMIIESINDNKMSLEEAFSNAAAFNMLNTRYFIVNPNAEALKNPFACGNAWFVKDYKIANNADEEIGALEALDPAKTAVIDKRFETLIQGFSAPSDSQSTISLVSHSPNHLIYDYNSLQDELTVFSEIYYDKGWNAYLDGRKVPHFRADFILRAIILPAGQHKIEFKFEPVSYYAGGNISLASSLILILLIAGYFVKEFFIKRKVA
jgi:hypothetical protein